MNAKHSDERRVPQAPSSLRELSQDELNSVSGGFIAVHLARTAAVIVAGAVTVIREATKGPEVLVPDLTQVMKT